MLDLYIALGSNVGNRLAQLESARQHLSAHYSITAISPVYETPALLPENAPDDWNRSFLNQVIQLQSEASPESVLAVCKSSEAVMGRVPTARWAPRVIDIDIVAYGEHVIAHSGLEIPHAQMHLRDFVLVPLCDIAPDWRYPPGHSRSGRSVSDLLKALPKIEAKRHEPN